MSSLGMSEFDEFFQALHNGDKPFAWQRRHLERLLTEGRYLDQVVAPTGTGKTALIDMHVFAVAAMAEGSEVVVPRRLALVAPRRALVDDQYEYALELARRLGPAYGDQPPVVQRVADALKSLRWPKSPPLEAIGEQCPLIVARLRGGLKPPKAWRDDPTACAILNCTPDMWGSRLLGRGYGSWPTAWPREMGLLGVDAVVVIDEAHLNRQLITTARSVASLLAKTTQPLLTPQHLQTTQRRRPGVPTLQVVETTATPSEKLEVVSGVRDADLKEDPVLAKRVSAPKELVLVRFSDWLKVTTKKGGDKDNYINLFVDQAIALREKCGPTVIVFVNTVAIATELASKLRKVDDPKFEVELVCGRLREHDLTKLKQRRPGLLSLKGNPEVDFVVATQSLEVGVDMDGSAGVSELAPADALVQRAGRINRLGARGKDPQTPRFAVIVPEDLSVFTSEDKQSSSGPYLMADLEAAYKWLLELERDKVGFAPKAFIGNPPPASLPKRKLFQRVELADTWWWARSSDDLDPDPDLDLWLSDDLEVDNDVAFVVRHDLPDDPEEAKEMLTCLPPQDHELFPTPISVARSVLEEVLRDESDDESDICLRVRDNKVCVLGKGDQGTLRPGDIIVVDDTTEMFREGVVVKDGKERMSDVLEDLEKPGRGGVLLRVDKQSWPEVAERLLQDCSEVLRDAGPENRQTRNKIADLLDAAARSDLIGQQNTGNRGRVGDADSTLIKARMAHHAAELLRKGRIKDCTITPRYGENGDLVRLMITDQRSAVSDDDARQTWTPSENPPTLTEHSAAAAKRGRYLADKIGLPTHIATIVEEAARHHDDGKVDSRFQKGRLGRLDSDDQPLAKGRKPPRGGKDTSGLPVGWRHEQLSVVYCYEELPPEMTADERDLVLRLVGTSHGSGRVAFPHTSAELGPPDHLAELAKRLFDEGEWDALVERTERTWGTWGCAYLEALVRAADGQVSGEGS
jgi:CRISPR-associated endonuclease/helicase Cas3